LLGLIGASVAAWPIRAHGQQALPLIGFLSSRSPEDSKPHLAGFLRGLAAFGYADGKTATIEYRWALGQYDRLPALAKELAALHPVAIAAAGGTPSARAAKAATHSIPTFFVTTDAVSEGLVESLNRPGGNITGVDFMSGELTGKRLELLAQLVPGDRPLAFLTDAMGAHRNAEIKINDAERAAQSLGRALVVEQVHDDAELDRNFAHLAEQKVAGLVVENDPYFDFKREHIIELTSRLAIPAMYHIRDFPAGGGLMSYGANLADAYYQMGVQVGRMLKGAKIADMPVIRPTKFELTLNLKTAKALGLNVPATLLAIADEVID
jgi:putative ABC transport system substrate-binding protein